MNGKQRDTVTPWVDPDDAPELTRTFFEHAEWRVGDVVVRPGRGRPPAETPKRQVTLRLDPDVLARLRASGPGWQTRVNAALRAWLEREEGAVR